MSTDTITIRRWFDRHLHPRMGQTAQVVFPCAVKQRATGAVIMGNLPHPYQTSTLEMTNRYRKELISLLPPDSDFELCMTCYLTDSISPEEVAAGYKYGVWRGVKLYMADQKSQGGTTGSQHGVRNLAGRYPVFARMEKDQVPLLGHFEAVEDEVDEFDREVVSMERDLMPIIKTFPGLPIVFEHITDGRVADFVAEVSHNIQATVTPHHMMLNRNALFYGGMNPDVWCKPVLKRETHRLKVRKYATSGHPRFGAGTDSAPHDESAKSQPCGCAAGIFHGQHAVELYATIFDQDNALENLETFLSKNFLALYGMEASQQMLVIERKPRQICKKVGTHRVFRGGQCLPFTLVA